MADPVEYRFPQVQTNGSRFNILKRIYKAVGRWPTALFDQSDLSDPENPAMETVVVFGSALSTQEEEDLNALVSAHVETIGDPPPVTGTVFIIEDIRQRIAQFNANTGENFELYVARDPISGEPDHFELHANRLLTPTEKQKVRDAWIDLASVEDR